MESTRTVPGSASGGQPGGEVDGGAVDVAEPGEDAAPHHGHPRLRKDLVLGEGLGQCERNFGAGRGCLGNVEDFVAHRLHQPAAADGNDLGAFVLEALHQLGERLFVHAPGQARVGNQVREADGPRQGQRGVVLVAFAALFAGLQSGLGPDGKPLDTGVELPAPGVDQHLLQGVHQGRQLR